METMKVDWAAGCYSYTSGYREKRSLRLCGYHNGCMKWFGLSAYRWEESFFEFYVFISMDVWSETDRLRTEERGVFWSELIISIEVWSELDRLHTDERRVFWSEVFISIEVWSATDRASWRNQKQVSPITWFLQNSYTKLTYYVYSFRRLHSRLSSKKVSH